LQSPPGASTLSHPSALTPHTITPDRSAASYKGDEPYQRHDLPFTLLSVEAGRVRELYGVPSTFGLFPGRVTYVIDGEGVVRHVFSSQLGVTRHVEEALRALREIQDQKKSYLEEAAGS
jgi:peroxiredoxin